MFFALLSLSIFNFVIQIALCDCSRRRVSFPLPFLRVTYAYGYKKGPPNYFSSAGEREGPPGGVNTKKRSSTLFFLREGGHLRAELTLKKGPPHCFSSAGGPPPGGANLSGCACIFLGLPSFF